MRIVLTLLIISLLVQPVMAGEPTQAEVTQVDNNAYPQVTIYVSVTDASGQVVTGLAKEQFEVTEDGQPVELNDFSTAASNTISTVLIIDRSISMEEENKLEGAQDAALAFVEMMRSQDQMAIVVFDERPSLLAAFTSDQATLEQAIRSIRTGNCTAIYDGVQAATDVIAGAPGRQLVILLTDGRDCREFPDMAERGSQISADEAIAYAQGYDVTVHVIGLGERGSTGDRRKGIDEPVLQRIAAETEGNYYYAPTASELKSLYESLAGKVQREYILTYTSPRPTYDGTRRDIQVRVAGQVIDTSYVEQHLLNVQSNWIVGLVFLTLLLLVAFLPGMAGVMHPRRSVALPTPPGQGQPSYPPSAPVACPRCHTVSRPGARFCGRCGQQFG